MIFALVVFPIIFFIIGFVFKLFKPHYRPIEFVLMNIVLSVLALMLSFGSALFYSIPYFIKMSLIHIAINFVFAFMGVLTNKLYEIFKEKFPMLGAVTQIITMLALISIMVTFSFTIQFVITLMY